MNVRTDRQTDRQNSHTLRICGAHSGSSQLAMYFFNTGLIADTYVELGLGNYDEGKLYNLYIQIKF